MTTSANRPVPEFSWDDFLKMRSLLLEKTGMFFDDNKFNVVRNVVSERMFSQAVPEFETYYRFITGTELPGKTKEQAHREFDRVVDNLTVNETSFFRNKDHYNAILQEVLPRLFRQKQDKRQLRLWSAGCSTGQEPYSLAMLVTEFLEERGQRVASPDDVRGWKVEIVASDISHKVLHVAQSGRFRREDMRGLDQARLERFFRPITSQHVATAPLDPSHVVLPGQFPMLRNVSRAAYEITPEIRAMVRFGYFNLALPVYPAEKVANFDLILCENVMIYFAPDVTRQVIENIYKALVDGGFLFIGFSETLWQVSERFKLINSHETFYYQKPYPDEQIARSHTASRPSTGPLRQPATNPDRPITGNLPVARPKPEDAPKVEESRGLKPALPAPATALARVQNEPPKALKVEKPKTGPLKPPAPNPAKPASGPLNETAEPDWKTALSEGLACMEAHDFEQAGKALAKALDAAPYEVEVLCAVAHLKVKLGEYEAAMEFSRKAIQLNPLAEQAHLLLAMLYQQQDRIEDAIKEFQQTIFINMDSVIAHMQLGDIWNKRRETNSALREYRSALRALEKYRPGEFIEELPVETLKRTCQENIRRLQGAQKLR